MHDKKRTQMAIGVSLSEPYTSGSALQRHVRISVC